MSTETRIATAADLDAWAAFRLALWPDGDPGELRREAVAILASEDEVGFVAVHPTRGAVGFAEGSVREAPNGPYGHLEGWYVMPEFRGRGHGEALADAFAQWCLHRAIRLLTSDTTPDYPLSPAAHARAGYRKLREFTIFLKELRED